MTRLQEVVTRVRALASEPYPEDSLDLIYFEFDRAFRMGRFDEADEVLGTLQPADFVRQRDNSVVIILAFMSITKAAADKLPARAGYVERVRAFLEGNPRRDSLMHGIA